MSSRLLARAALFLLCAGIATTAYSHGARAPYDIQSIALARRLALTDMPVADAGVTDLRFADFFVTPTGSLGLEFTERVRALDGRRVRLVGYVVGQDKPSPGRFILAPFRVQLSTAADGPADDLPPAHVYVALPPRLAAADLPPIPVPIVVQGTLRLGAQPEADARVSWVRIELDPDDPRLLAPSDADARVTRNAAPR